MEQDNFRIFDRDFSWLSFNHRVLQEAQDESVPLLERLKFLAIYSSNLDEFYRVRVAHHRSLMKLKKKTKSKYGLHPEEMVDKINQIVDQQQQTFGHIFRNEILKGLKEHNIFLLREDKLEPAHKKYLTNYCSQHIEEHLELIKTTEGEAPFLKDRVVYFAIQVTTAKGMERYLLELPHEKCGRFLVVPDKKKHLVVQLDDIIRMYLNRYFSTADGLEVYAVKISRDAELYLEDEFEETTILEKIKKSLSKRLTGVPSRFLYDNKMPKEFRRYLRKSLQLKKQDMIPGGRYHNFNDFFGFPAPKNPALNFEPHPNLPAVDFEGITDYFEVLRKKDVLLHFPYQNYQYVVDMLEQAANDKSVKSIKITLYRVASDSAVGVALEKAAKNGIAVTIFDEVQARFDEASNVYWGDRFAKAGAKVLYSYEKLKVHTKLFLIEREEGKKMAYYTYLGTGNFNEKTARIYGDHALLTSHEQIAKEAGQVFAYLENRELSHKYKHLLVAPFGLRPGFEKLVEREIKNAKAGEKASMVLKMNSLEDTEMIRLLYKASNAGVKIRLIIRGICCLAPGVEGLSKNIKITSIVDRYLEHARVFIFHNSGSPEYYIASSDWMTRNLSRRVEVAFPIHDKKLQKELQQIINLQLKDAQKARVINLRQTNSYKKSSASNKVRAQYAIYEMLKKKAEKAGLL